MSLKYKIVVIVTPLVFILDQLTKMIIRGDVVYGEQISVIPGYFDIIHVTNTGAAFGMMASLSPSFRVPFFYIVSVVALVVIMVALIRLPANAKYLSLVFGLILGGIAGNALDRIRFGKVTDFLSFHIQARFEWPAFNVADSAITIAMILLIWGLLRSSKGRE